MSNRADRRRMMREMTGKNKALVASYNREQRIAGLVQNGITPEDLKNEYARGVEDGEKEAGLTIVKACYAGICIALHDEFGFGSKRCYKAIRAVDEKVQYALTHYELVDEVLKKTGLILELDEPFERVQMVNEQEEE